MKKYLIRKGFSKIAQIHFVCGFTLLVMLTLSNKEKKRRSFFTVFALFSLENTASAWIISVPSSNKQRFTTLLEFYSCIYIYIYIYIERERERERQRQRDRDRERDRERQTETQRQRETERERQRYRVLCSALIWLFTVEWHCLPSISQSKNIPVVGMRLCVELEVDACRNVSAMPALTNRQPDYLPSVPGVWCWGITAKSRKPAIVQ